MKFLRKIIFLVKKLGIHSFIKNRYPAFYCRLKIFILTKLLTAHPWMTGDSCLWPFCPSESSNKQPLVSVIVPNYNHENYLKERLDSIYGQSYQNIEVILLDDCSTDNSRFILKEYQKKYPQKTKLIFNEKNSGSPFSQWERGIASASGELIWIAESDDWCELNFVASLVPYFQDEMVRLAFANTLFIKDGVKVWSLQEYIHDLGAKIFKRDFLQTAHLLTQQYFSKRNLIVNVSSCIFRNPAGHPIFQDEEWKRMRVCGDWIFYLNIIRGGVVAYSAQTTNYYRQHSNNTSVKAQKEDLYYREHQIVGKHLALLYNVSEKTLLQFESRMKELWKLHRTDFTEEHFSRCYDHSYIVSLCAKRKLNIAMCGFAFSFGGGETVPIVLANELYNLGYAVSFINFNEEPTAPGVRAKLSPLIPVLTLNSQKERLRHYLRLLGIEIIHSHHASVDYAIAQLKPPYIVQAITLHGMYETIEKQYLSLMAPTLKDAVDLWFYTAKKNLFLFHDYDIASSEMIHKITNGLPESKILPQERATYNIPQGAFVFTLVSRALPTKGWKEAIQAIALARKKTEYDIRLILVGEGEEYTRLKDCSPDFVYFVGYQQDIRPFFAMSDMGLLPSYYPGESLPLVIIDSLFSGKPVLATNIGEIPDMLSDKDNCLAGFIIKLHNMQIDINEFVDAIVKCVTDHDFYSEICSRVNIVANKFRIANVAEQYASLYLEAYKRKMTVKK